MRFSPDKYPFLNAVLAGIACIFTACSEQKEIVAVHTPDPAKAIAAQDSCIRALRTGDILLRCGNDGASMIFREFNQKDKNWSHCGIVAVEDGYPFVYHCIGGEDNPDQRMRRDSVSRFIGTDHNLAVGIARYDFDSSERAKLVACVYDFYRKQPSFDLDFDLKTDDRLYCAELVYKCLQRATEDTNLIRPYIEDGFRYVAIDKLFLHPRAKLVWQVRY